MECLGVKCPWEEWLGVEGAGEEYLGQGCIKFLIIKSVGEENQGEGNIMAVGYGYGYVNRLGLATCMLVGTQLRKNIT